MPTLYDLAVASGSKVAFDDLTPEAQGFLSIQVPKGYPANRAARLGAIVSEHLPRATAVRAATQRVRRAGRQNSVMASEGPWPGARTDFVVDPEVAAASRAGRDLTEAIAAEGRPTATQRMYSGLPT